MELQFIDISRDTEDKKKKAEVHDTTIRTVKRTDVSKRSQQVRKRNDVNSRNHRMYRKHRAQSRGTKRTRGKIVRLLILLGMFLGIILCCLLLYNIIRGFAGHGIFADVFSEERRTIVYQNSVEKPLITEDFLTVNPNSRPGYALNQVNNIFVHYTANPGTSAAQNRSYFENLGITQETSASAHFIIGYEGEIIQCLPLEEIGYAVKTRNQDSISIECCYLQEDGEFTEETYQSLVGLCAWLLNEYDLTPKEILRHYDEGGKKCPLYYVEHEDAWQQFLMDVRQCILSTAE